MLLLWAGFAFVLQRAVKYENRFLFGSHKSFAKGERAKVTWGRATRKPETGCAVGRKSSRVIKIPARWIYRKHGKMEKNDALGDNPCLFGEWMGGGGRINENLNFISHQVVINPRVKWGTITSNRWLYLLCEKRINYHTLRTNQRTSSDCEIASVWNKSSELELNAS